MSLAAAQVLLSLVILPLGDSITEGVPYEDEPSGGYRAALARELGGAGVKVTYVGGRRSPAGAHEGWSGSTAAELLPRLQATLGRTRPEVVLLHIGTNDLGLGVPVEKAVDDVRRLLLAIDAASKKPDAAKPIRVLLAQIIGRRLSGRDPDRDLRAYNERLAALAAERRRAGQPVELVDMHAALDPRTDLVDALHPNETGYRKIAAAWAAAVKRVAAPRR